MTPEEHRRENAADRVAYMAGELSLAVLLVRLRTELLEERLRYAAEHGVSRAECEAMTREGLDGIDVKGTLDRAYAPGQEEADANLTGEAV